MKTSDLVLALALAVEVAAVPALAEDQAVSIEITGTVEPRCENNGFTYPLEVRDLTKAGSSALQFQAGCNAPFQYRVQSARGAFSADRANPAPSGFAAAVPYSVTVHIPLTGGGAIDDRFTSADISPEKSQFPFSTSRNAVSIRQTAEMRIAWDASPKPLLPGIYQDQLTVTLSIRP